MDIKFQFKWNICGLSIYRGFFELKLSLNSPPRPVCVHSCVHSCTAVDLSLPLIRNRAVAAACEKRPLSRKICKFCCPRGGSTGILIFHMLLRYYDVQL